MTNPRLPLAPAAVRYIKLGAGGRWEAAALDGSTIEWGDADNPHALAAAGDWTATRDYYLAAGMSPGTATDVTRALRDFYTLGSDTLWITFARDHLWWAFAGPAVIERDVPTPAVGASYRRTLRPWRCTDITGEPLRITALSTRLTQLAGYRGTICGVAAADYLLRRINSIDEPMVAAARAARDALIDSVADLIRQLHWADFELFVDLVFTRAGWQRTSMLGGTMKDVDLILEQPVTGEQISVQVKSKADQKTLDASVAAFAASPLATRFFFVTHSSPAALAVPAAATRQVHLWTADTLSRRAVDAGLVDWLIARAA